MGDLWMMDPETGRQVQVNTSRRRVRERFAARRRGRARGGRRDAAPRRRRPPRAVHPGRLAARLRPPPAPRRGRAARGRPVAHGGHRAAGRRERRRAGAGARRMSAPDDHARARRGRELRGADPPPRARAGAARGARLRRRCSGRKRREAATFANPALMPNLVTARPGWRRHLPPLLLLLALAAMVVALARPAAHGRRARAGGDGDDGHRRLRLDERHRRRAEPAHRRGPRGQPAHRQAARDVPARPRHVLGLRRAARRAVDRPRRACDGALDRLTAVGGTAMGLGLERGLEAARTPVPDDERHRHAAAARGARAAVRRQGHPGRRQTRSRSPQRARAARIPIYAIALGTPDGEVEVQDSFGLTQRIRVPPDVETLKEIARVSRGRFYEAADSAKLEEIYARPRHPPVLARGQGGGHRRVRRRRARAPAGRRRAVDGLVRPPASSARSASSVITAS